MPPPADPHDIGASTDGVAVATAGDVLADPDRPASDADVSGEGQRPSTTRTLVEWVAVIGGALVVALVIKTFLVQAFYIPSGSMEPTLEVGDRVLVNKLSYDFHDVNRGDLVVFERPEGTSGEIKDLIKRVIALPGEMIEGRDGVVTVDGRILDEPYLADDEVIADFAVIKVPEGEVFVMGDNRDSSMDSRSFGPIAADDIVGRAFVRVWPLGALGTL